MLKNYLKIAWRSLLKNKAYSLLNITGLAAGMAVALLIALWMVNEFSYDKFLPNYTRLYKVEMNFTNKHDGVRTIDGSPLPLVDVLRSEIPEIKQVAESDWMDKHSLMVGEKKINTNGAIIGSDFLNMFQYPLLQGHASTVLKDPYSIVLTASTAKALFGNEDPLNKMVRIDNQHDLKVTGILKDLPENSSLDFNYLVPFSFLDQTDNWVKRMRTNWNGIGFQLFVELQAEADYSQVVSKIKNIAYNHTAPELRFAKPEIILHPLKDWRLYSDFKNGKSVGGYIDYVYMFGSIGILVLLIACINFMNLSTARSVKRSKEVGVRKAIGSQRSNLIAQFLTESILITFIAFLFSMLFVQLALSPFNTLTGSTVSIPFSSAVFWVIMLAYVLLTGVLAGSRPAFYLSSFNPVKILKGNIQTGKGATLSRKFLVVLQFSCSIALIIGTLVIYRQIQFVKDRPTGYSADRLLMTDMSSDLNKNYEALKNDLLQTGMVESVANASSPVTNIYNHTAFNDWPGKSASDEIVSTGLVNVSDTYFKTVGMQLKSGRNFSNNPDADSTNAIVNEAAIKRMGLKDPLNQPIVCGRDNKVRIIGVVKDALMESPFTPVDPVIFIHGRKKDASTMLYRLLPDVKIQDALVVFTKLFDKYNPAYPYSYRFVDDEFNQKFNLETLVGKLAGIFAGLAIFISCLGLFGLAAYTAEQRTKEIGIRKVLGASIAQVWMLLCKDFIVLVLLSSIVASPIAFYFLQNWLQEYDYRISIGPGVFILSAMAALLITLVTISFQAIKAAVTNPVKSLRTE